MYSQNQQTHASRIVQERVLVLQTVTKLQPCDHGDGGAVGGWSCLRYNSRYKGQNILCEGRGAYFGNNAIGTGVYGMVVRCKGFMITIIHLIGSNVERWSEGGGE